MRREPMELPVASSLWTPTLYQQCLPSPRWPRGHIRRWEYSSLPRQPGCNAIVVDSPAQWHSWRGYGRYYGFLDRWLSVYVTFDSDTLEPTGHPADDFPFAFNCDITVPHYVDGEAIYTTDLHLDVLVLADGTTHHLKDIDQFERAYHDGLFGRTWYEGARLEAERVIGEATAGRFIDMLQEAAPFPETSNRASPPVLTELEPMDLDFKRHPRFPRF